MAEEHPLALALSLPPLAKGKEEASPRATKTSAAEDQRARRRHMSRLYAELGAQLPGGLPRRATSERILDDAIAYVGVLRATFGGGSSSTPGAPILLVKLDVVGNP